MVSKNNDMIEPRRVRLPILNADVTPMTAADLVCWIIENGHSRSKHLIANHNLHSLYLLETDPNFQSAYDMASIILIDGFPVLKLSQLAKPGNYGIHHRIGSTDWINLVVSESNIKRLAVVGGIPSSNNEAVSRLSKLNKKVEVGGWHGMEWSREREVEVNKELWNFRPDLVLVGLGMPLQESFLINSWTNLPPAIYATVGGAIDQISGKQHHAPRWLGRFGLEWAWRLVSQPRRLAYRYTIEPILLMYAVLSKRFLSNRRAVN